MVTWITGLFLIYTTRDRFRCMRHCEQTTFLTDVFFHIPYLTQLHPSDDVETSHVSAGSCGEIPCVKSNQLHHGALQGSERLHRVDLNSHQAHLTVTVYTATRERCRVAAVVMVVMLFVRLSRRVSLLCLQVGSDRFLPVPCPLCITRLKILFPAMYPILEDGR
jgi:hypothetical protein